MGKKGFIGLGSQGGPMARCMIDAGYDVVLWARREETLAPFTGSSATIAGSVEALASQVDYCAVCVTDDDGVRLVCDALIPAMPAGGVIVIHSTVHPGLCRSLAVQAKARGLSLVDAPVSGGGGAAAERALTVMAGGDEKAIDVVRPIFATFAGLVVHLGDVGSGQLAKLVNNNLMAANLALAHNAFALAQSQGLDREAFRQLVGVSSGRSFSFEVRARMSDPTNFRHGAQLLAKDVRLLGEVSGDNPDYLSIRAAAMSFLDLALAEQDGQ